MREPARTHPSSPYCDLDNDILRQLRSTVVRTLRGSGYRHEIIEDAVQEALTALICHSGAVHAPEGWTQVVARRTASRLHRQEQRHAAAMEAASETPSPEEGLLERELGRTAALALQALADRDREIIVRRVLDGDTTSEVAAELGLTYDATKARLHRALARLRVQMSTTLSGIAGMFTAVRRSSASQHGSQVSASVMAAMVAVTAAIMPAVPHGHSSDAPFEAVRLTAGERGAREQEVADPDRAASLVAGHPRTDAGGPLDAGPSTASPVPSHPQKEVILGAGGIDVNRRDELPAEPDLYLNVAGAEIAIYVARHIPDPPPIPDPDAPADAMGTQSWSSHPAA